MEYGGARGSERRSVTRAMEHASSEMRPAWQASPATGAWGAAVSSTKTRRLKISSPSGFSLFSIRTARVESKSSSASRRSANVRSTRPQKRTASGACQRRRIDAFIALNLHSNGPAKAPVLCFKGPRDNALPETTHEGRRLTKFVTCSPSRDRRSSGRPYTTAGGKTAHARVRRVDQPAFIDERIWGAHERVAVRRG